MTRALLLCSFVATALLLWPGNTEALLGCSLEQRDATTTVYGSCSFSLGLQTYCKNTDLVINGNIKRCFSYTDPDFASILYPYVVHCLPWQYEIISGSLSPSAIQAKPGCGGYSGATLHYSFVNATECLCLEHHD